MTITRIVSDHRISTWKFLPEYCERDVLMG